MRAGSADARSRWATSSPSSLRSPWGSTIGGKLGPPPVPALERIGRSGPRGRHRWAQERDEGGEVVVPAVALRALADIGTRRHAREARALAAQVGVVGVAGSGGDVGRAAVGRSRGASDADLPRKTHSL